MNKIRVKTSRHRDESRLTQNGRNLIYKLCSSVVHKCVKKFQNRFFVLGILPILRKLISFDVKGNE